MSFQFLPYRNIKRALLAHLAFNLGAFILYYDRTFTIDGPHTDSQVEGTVPDTLLYFISKSASYLNWNLIYLQPPIFAITTQTYSIRC